MKKLLFIALLTGCEVGPYLGVCTLETKPGITLPAMACHLDEENGRNWLYCEDHNVYRYYVKANCSRGIKGRLEPKEVEPIILPGVTF